MGRKTFAGWAFFISRRTDSAGKIKSISSDFLQQRKGSKRPSEVQVNDPFKPNAVAATGVESQVGSVFDCETKDRAPVVSARADHGAIVIGITMGAGCGEENIRGAGIFYTSRPGFRGKEFVHVSASSQKAGERNPARAGAITVGRFWEPGSEFRSRTSNFAWLRPSFDARCYPAGPGVMINLRHGSACVFCKQPAEKEGVINAPCFSIFALIFLVAVGFFCSGQSARADERLETLQILTKAGAHKLRVEVARSPEQQERGLMFRKELPKDQGMFFDLGTERPVSMWMKNTYIPLDMLFISKSGTIVSMVKNATPMSEEVLNSGGAARAVLEVNAGTADRLGIAIGDQVVYPLFPADK